MYHESVSWRYNCRVKLEEFRKDLLNGESLGDVPRARVAGGILLLIEVYTEELVWCLKS